MENSLVSLKKYNMFLVKKIETSNYEITPLDGEKFKINLFVFRLFKNDFTYFKVSESYLGEFFLFIRKTELSKMKIELFLEKTFKHTIYFYINYDERKLYNFFLPIIRTNIENTFFTLPDFPEVQRVINLTNIKTNIKFNEDIKEIIIETNTKEMFLDFCKNNLEEHQYDEVRLLWEIL